jgi:hypothetical protein
MAWEVEYTDEFAQWWDSLNEQEQIDVTAYVKQLQGLGPTLGFPHSSDVKSSRHGGMRELRIQSGGKPFRIFYAFDPRRTAILLIGGKKGGDDRFYDQFVRVADRFFDEHLAELNRERINAKYSTVLGTRGEDVAGSKGPRGPKV